jgi:hypothetical protein
VQTNFLIDQSIVPLRGQLLTGIRAPGVAAACVAVGAGELAAGWALPTGSEVTRQFGRSERWDRLATGLGRAGQLAGAAETPTPQ